MWLGIHKGLQLGGNYANNHMRLEPTRLYSLPRREARRRRHHPRDLFPMRQENYEGGVKMTRAEHLQWCKDRALQYVDAGDLTQAFASMSSDLNKHPDTKGHLGMELGMMEQMSGGLNTADKMRRHIEGYN